MRKSQVANNVRVKHWRLEHAKKASNCYIAWQQEKEGERKDTERKRLRKKKENEARAKKENKKTENTSKNACTTAYTDTCN